MDPLSLMVGGVLAAFGGEAVKTAGVPLEAWRQHKVERIKHRLQRAQAAAERAAGEAPLDPSDRVAYKALTEAALTDDELVADYLGGVVASSSSSDDSGVPVLAQIARLSSLQLRAHYVIYREARRLVADESINLYSAHQNPWIDIVRGAWIRVTDDPDIGLRLASTMYTLANEGLIGSAWRYNPVADDETGEYHVRVQLSAPGAELFLWGHGLGRTAANTLFDRSVKLSLLSEVPATCEAFLRPGPDEVAHTPVRAEPSDNDDPST